MRVLLDETAPFRLGHATDLDRLRDRRGHQLVELERPIVVAIAPEQQVNTERPDRLLVDDQRHANKRQLLALVPPGGSIQEERLPARLGNDDRFAALDDAAGDPLAEAIPGPLPLDGEAARRLDV